MSRRDTLLLDNESAAEEDSRIYTVHPDTQNINDDSSTTQTEKSLAMSHGDTYPPLIADEAAYIVTFAPNDELHPFNWPAKKKKKNALILIFVTFISVWGSSAYAGSVFGIEEEFHVAEVVSILGMSLYVLGFATGPILWAPLSEIYGRRIPIILAAFGVSVFSFGSATAKDLQTVLICRFFAGCFAASPMVVVAGAFSDMFDNQQRGLSVANFCTIIMCSPVLAPIASSFFAQYQGWRWPLYLTGIVSGVTFGLAVLFLDETFHPSILARKAHAIRQKTGNWAIHAVSPAESVTMSKILTNDLLIPFKLLYTDVIVLLVSIYQSFVYGILYLLLEAYPIIFLQGYGMTMGVSELPYLGLMIGIIIALVTFYVVYEPRYIKALEKNNGVPPAEKRLESMVVGGIVFAMGIFWLCWTGNYPRKVHWMAPTASGVFTGYGLITIFVSCFNYIIDSHLTIVASALASSTIMRSSFAAAFPLFATFMFRNMGINWAGTLIGCIAVVLIPVPLFFIKFGKGIRERMEIKNAAQEK